MKRITGSRQENVPPGHDGRWLEPQAKFATLCHWYSYDQLKVIIENLILTSSPNDQSILSVLLKELVKMHDQIIAWNRVNPDQVRYRVSTNDGQHLTLSVEQLMNPSTNR